MFLVLAALLSLTESRSTSSDTVAFRVAATVCGSPHGATSPLPPTSMSLQRLPISFLPALTGNKGRSKHVVGAFLCALQVSSVTTSGSQHNIVEDHALMTLLPAAAMINYSSGDFEICVLRATYDTVACSLVKSLRHAAHTFIEHFLATKARKIARFAHFSLTFDIQRLCPI